MPKDRKQHTAALGGEVVSARRRCQGADDALPKLGVTITYTALR